jgi:hypothetical protein
MRRDCYGVDFGPYDRTQDSTWGSSNTSVMTVSVGTVSCLSEGSAGITAQFQAVVYGLNCFQNFINPMSQGNVVVRTPHHLKVISDTHKMTSCGSLLRIIKYQVIDRNGMDTGVTPTKETFSPSTVTNSCNGSTIRPTTCSTDNPDAAFRDNISVGCPSTGCNCGFEATTTWQWCPPGRPAVPLATINAKVHHSSMLINSFSDLPVGTEIYP